MVSIDDGDSLVVLAAGHKVRVRLAGIDAPEWRQPGGQSAKQALTRLVYGKTVTVSPLTTDRYGRTVAHLSVAGVKVSHELVRTGKVWVYHRYNQDPALVELEQQAQQAGRGLWKLPTAQRVPPWEWRRLHPR